MMSLDMMKHNSLEEVVKEIDTSTSHRGAKRFESKTENGKTLVRACFCRNLELVCTLYINQRKDKQCCKEFNSTLSKFTFIDPASIVLFMLMLLFAIVYCLYGF